jgi:zinc transport system substrate-binding protein
MVQPTAGVSLLAADDHGEGAGDEHVELAGGKDPHVWLDPRRFATMAGNVAAELSRRDPAHAAAYAANAATLTGELTALDTAWRAGTKTCANRTLVVSHEAFGYLADAYGFEQVGITGIAPDSEPNPRQLSSIAGTVRDRGVRTVYSETLVDPRIAQTVADEAGAQVKVLDPVEGIPAGSDDDYLSIMRRNLDTVRAGQPCT